MVEVLKIIDARLLRDQTLPEVGGYVDVEEHARSDRHAHNCSQESELSFMVRLIGTWVDQPLVSAIISNVISLVGTGNKEGQGGRVKFCAHVCKTFTEETSII